MASRAARLDALCDAADRIPGLLDVLERTVARVRDLHKGYRAIHWGDHGRQPVKGGAVIPDAHKGIVVLGALLEIVYVTRKGRSGLDEWEHRFSAPLPILGVAPDGNRQGLVVVRGDSRYTVTDRGIVG